MPSLRSVTIENFKCFRQGSFKLGSLTLLAGMNGTGKSTVIQSLLLLRQSWQQKVLQKGQLALNGDLVCIGSGQDALCEDADPKVITFLLDWEDDHETCWRWAYSQFRRILPLHEGDVTESKNLEKRIPFTGDVCYLTAERHPPASYFPMSGPAVEGHRYLGPRGEFTAHFLSVFREERLPCPKLQRPQEPDSLFRQVEAWLNVIRPGLRIDVKHHDFMDTVELAYQFRNGRLYSGRFRSTNVGFGLTYVLPVIVALLATRPGGLVIIENPEAHLHPRGQSQIGALCALTAAAGVQVIVETHSDHVLNGIRIAVREGQIDPEAVAVHFFTTIEDPSGVSPEIHSPNVDSNGRFDHWPSGFFDEWDQALDRLLD